MEKELLISSATTFANKDLSYFTAFNHNSAAHNREEYKKKLALFEEDCALVPYLSSTMRGGYKPPNERPIDFEFKLNRFLSLKVSPEASGVL